MVYAPNLHLPKVEHAGELSILTFTDGKAPDVENVLALELVSLRQAHEMRHVLLDFRNVTSINGGELGTLVALHRRLKAAGRCLTLFNLAPPVYEVFEICRLHLLLGIGR